MRLEPKLLRRGFVFAVLSCLALGSRLDAEVLASFVHGEDEQGSEAVFEVKEQGLYSLHADGPGGMRVEMIDRMYGELGATEIPLDPARSSTRFQCFLEPGSYKLRTTKPLGAVAKVSVERFREAGTIAPRDEAQWAAEYGRFRSFELGEGELLYFRVRIGTEANRLDFFAIGRSLGGMALFRAGAWDTGISPFSGKVETEKGKPRAYFGYAVDLEPGEYQIACWGGPALPWATKGPERDLSIMEGMRRMDALGLHEITLDASGLECIALPAEASFAQASARDGAPFSLSWTPIGGDRLSGPIAAMDARGGYKTATLHMSGGAKGKWLVARGNPGRKLELRFFPERGADQSVMRLAADRGSGAYAMRFLGSVEGEDAGPLTALAGSLPSSWTGSTPRDLGARGITARSPIELSEAKPLRLQANLLDWMAYVLDVAEAGRFVVLEKSAEKTAASWSFYPIQGSALMLMDAKSAKAGKSVQLDAGLHIVIVQPERPGFLDALIAKEGVETLVGGGSLWSRSPEPGRNAIAWYDLAFNGADRNQLGLFIGRRPGTSQGYALRKLPAQMAEPLGLRIGGEEIVTIGIELKAPSRLRFAAGSAYLRVDGQDWKESALYAAGEHSLELSAPGKDERWVTLEALASPKLPPEEALAFQEGEAFWSEFRAGETKRFFLDVASPTIYSVATTGRLAMKISLRSPLRISLAKDEGSGPGRNARIDAFLKPGRYLAELSAISPSAGWAGIAIERRGPRELPALSAGKTIRATVAAGESVTMPLLVEEGGQWGIEALGLGRDFAYRLEDEGGWPVGEPVDEGYASVALAKGKYRYYSLAAEVSTRRVFSAFREEGARPRIDGAESKSFHAELDLPYSRAWRGPGPDQAWIILPVSATVQLSLSESMAYSVTGPDGATIEAGLGGNPVILALPMGKSSIALSPIIEDEELSYSFELFCGDLMEGRPRAVGPGSVLPLAVGREGFWELTTRGAEELAFALYEPSGSGMRLLAESSEIPDDWNSRIALRLAPGRYEARFFAPGNPDADGAGGGGSIAALRFRNDVAAGSFAPPFTASAAVDAEIAVFAIAVEATGPYRFLADCSDSVEIILERGGRTLASGKGALVAVLEAKGRYVARCARSGEGPTSISLTCSALSFERGAMNAAGLVESGAEALLLADPGAASRIFEGSGILAASGIDRAFRPVGNDPVLADGLWIIREGGVEIGRLRALPATLSTPSSSLALPLYPTGQKISVRVPTASAALLRIDTLGIEASLTELAAGSPSAGTDWSACALTGSSTLLGLAPGDRSILVRDSREEGAGRIVTLSLASYPIQGAEAASIGDRRSLSLDPGGAILVRAPSGGALLELSLEKGLVAYISEGRTRRTFSALESSASFDEGDFAGSLYLVNPGRSRALASLSILPRSENPASLLDEARPFESEVSEAGRIDMRVAGKSGAPLIAIAGSASSCKFYDEESGLIKAGERLSCEAGELFVIPGRKGILAIEAEKGYLRAWLGEGSRLARDFVDSDRLAGSAPELGGGKALNGESASAFSIRVAEGGGLLSARASGAGVLALADSEGKILGAAGGARAQELLLPVAIGVYTLLARPFRGAERRGSLSAEIILPPRIAASGQGEPRLIRPGERQAFRFSVAEEGLVGAGLKAEKDGLSARVYDARMAPISTGPATIRRLAAGDYYLIVGSELSTVRYATVFAGLEGSRSEIPAEILAGYLKDGE